MTGTEQHIDQGEVVARAEVCTVSLEAAQVVASGPLFAELGDPDSMLYKVAAKRSAALPEGNRLGIVPALLTDPTRSGVVVARYLQQEGRLPDQIAGQGADQMVTLWAVEAKKADIPPLLVPEGAEEAAMDVADRMQMRGDGPVIFSRERAGEVPVNPKSRFFITGGARGANRQRIQTAMALKDAHPDHGSYYCDH